MSRADEGRQTLLGMLGEGGKRPVEDVISGLTYCEIGVKPTLLLATVAARPDDFKPRFLAELDLTPEQVDALELARPGERHAYFLHTFALYFLGLWHDEQAFDRIVAYMAADSNLAAEQLDDVVTEHLPAILARTYGGGDLGALKGIIEDPAADMWVRGACLRALHAMARMGKLPRADVISYFADVAERLRGTTTDDFGLELVSALADTREAALKGAIQQWFADGLVDESIVSRKDVEAAYTERPEHVEQQLMRREFFDQLLDELCDWPWFNSTDPSEFEAEADEEDEDQDAFEAALAAEGRQPVVRDGRKVGRNEPCPCGSGKKYKKCCLAEA